MGAGGGQGGDSVGVFPNKVAHSASNKLKAMRICAWGDEAKVFSRTDLQDLGQRDLLQEDAALSKMNVQIKQPRS